MPFSLLRESVFVRFVRLTATFCLISHSIQAAYRGYRGRLVGKAYLQGERKKLREQYRIRQEHNHIRESTWYQLLDIFGKAYTLGGDTMEEAVLKTVSILSKYVLVFGSKVPRS